MTKNKAKSESYTQKTSEPCVSKTKSELFVGEICLQKWSKVS